MRAELWLFGDDHCVQMRYMELFFSEKFARMFQKSQAGDVFPLRIGVRKMCADVAESRGAEQRVANCVGQRVAVGVSHWAFVKWHFDSAEDEFASFREAMKIVADSCARHRAARSSRR